MECGQLCGRLLGFHGNREALIKNKIRLFKLEPRCHTVEGGASRAWGTNTQLCPCCLSQRKGGKDIGFLGWQLGLLVGKARLPEREEKPVSVRRDVTVCALPRFNMHCLISKFIFLGNNIRKPWEFIIKGLKKLLIRNV